METMEAWFMARQQWAYDHAILPDGKWRLCLGTLVFGREYVDRFLDYCLPSLKAPGNLLSLTDPQIVIHTDRDNVDRLHAALSPIGDRVRIEIEEIPPDLIAMSAEHIANKYWLLSCVNNLHMQRAKYRAHAYHMLMPDHVYAAGYFENLERLARSGRRVIVQGAISTDLNKIGHRLTGSLTPQELTAVALDGLHEQCNKAILNDYPEGHYPNSGYMVAIGRSRIEIMSGHMSIVYFAHDVLMRAPLRMFNTVDTQLPFFVPEDVEPYVPSADDGMVYVEISAPEKQYAPAESATIVEVCARFWVHHYCTRGYERFFRLTTIMPLPDGYRHKIAPMPDEKIAAVQSLVRTAIAKSYDEIVPIVPAELRVDPITRFDEKMAA